MKNEFALAFNEVLEEKQLPKEIILKALESYRDEVQKGEFPTDQHSFHIDEKELSKIKG